MAAEGSGGEDIWRGYMATRSARQCNRRDDEARYDVGGLGSGCVRQDSRRALEEGGGGGWQRRSAGTPWAR